MSGVLDLELDALLDLAVEDVATTVIAHIESVPHASVVCTLLFRR
ncbi:hypothetical protein NBCG_04904 [Nocardioidaceae bacterium Broad-1]|nr:hypothetical protein NBCG_04904 [Nocardioidaceae bacterium Broad-1]